MYSGGRRKLMNQALVVPRSALLWSACSGTLGGVAVQVFLPLFLCNRGGTKHPGAETVGSVWAAWPHAMGRLHTQCSVTTIRSPNEDVGQHRVCIVSRGRVFSYFVLKTVLARILGKQNAVAGTASHRLSRTTGYLSSLWLRFPVSHASCLASDLM